MEKNRKKRHQDSRKNTALADAFTAAGIKPDQFKQVPPEKTPEPIFTKKSTRKETDWESVKSMTTPLSSKSRETREPNVCKPGNWLRNYTLNKSEAVSTKTGASQQAYRKNNHLKSTTKNNAVATRQNTPSEYGYEEYYSGIPYKISLSERKIQSNQSKKIDIKATHTSPVFQVLGPLIPKRSSFVYRIAQDREIPSHDGIEKSLSSQANDEGELIIGLDFGTSTVKVVVHDPQRKVFYAVPFYSLGSDNPFIFPSRVWLGTEGYSIDHGDRSFADLKLPLMEDQADPIQLIHATAFLALIIRHARGWLFSRHKDIYKNTDNVWALNLGLPAAYSEDNARQYRFRLLALAAINLASDANLRIEPTLVEQYLKKAISALSGDSYSTDLVVYPDMVNVYPEIGAQVRAFVDTESWDGKNRPYITMIDIGAGTVDISFFSVIKVNGKYTFNFFKNSVKFYGVINLHRNRIRWFNKTLSGDRFFNTDAQTFLKELESPTDVFLSMPESVSDYFENLGISSGSPDEAFYSDYKRQVSELLNDTRQNRVPLDDDKWKRLPLFLCGGGSRMEFYRKVVDQLNHSHTTSTWLGVELETLTRPSRLRADGLPDREYDRLSVAFGLSFPELGKVIPSHQIEDSRRSDLPRRPMPVDQTDDG